MKSRYAAAIPMTDPAVMAKNAMIHGLKPPPAGVGVVDADGVTVSPDMLTLGVGCDEGVAVIICAVALGTVDDCAG